MVTATKRKAEGGGRKGEKAQGTGISAFAGASAIVGSEDGRSVNTATPAKAKEEEILPADILIGRIERCPFQPRVDFPEQEIKDLAASIAEQGQIQPVTVRIDPAWETSKCAKWSSNDVRYQLVDGERRWRAVKSLGWKTIRAEIQPHTDAQVRAIVLATALQRKDLNAIEEARAFKAAIDAGDAAGPTELARQLGLSQGHVSNRLGLLDLPEKVQAKVISREIPPTHARSICRYKDSPAIITEILEAASWRMKHHGSLDSATEWDHDVDRTALNATKPIGGKAYSRKLGREVPIFTPTEEQREQLGLVSVSRGYMPRGDNKPELRATNVKLWEKLQVEHEAHLAKKADKKAEGGTGSASGTPAKNAKPLTAAQKKRLETQEREREKDRARRLERGAWHVAIDWRRWLLAEVFRGHDQSAAGCSPMSVVGVGAEDVLRLLLYFSASQNWHRGRMTSWTMSQNRLALRESVLARQLKAGSRGGAPDLLAALREVDDREVMDRACQFLAEMFWSKDGPVQVIPDEDVLAVTELLAIDLAAEWHDHAASELTERWLNLHGKEALVSMTEKLGCGPGLSSDSPKKHRVGVLVNFARKLKPPADLVKPKKPKGR